ncbi:MAG: PA2779 family protein [Nitrospirae bacterium]|nr:PA2779 family protein [Nitrospirota bacterium]
MKKSLTRYISWYLMVAMFIIGIAPRADAGLVPSELMIVSQIDRTADFEKIQKVLEMKMVGDRLEKFGLTKDEIQKKLTTLSDQQIHGLALRIDDLKVGKDDVVGAVVVILVVAILVVLLLQLSGRRVIVTR